MYICEKCGNEFDEPKLKKTTYENFYGVSDEFLSETTMIMNVCPKCESDDIKEVEDNGE